MQHSVIISYDNLVAQERIYTSNCHNQLAEIWSIMSDGTNEITNNILFIINDSPYGIEHPYNALRLAINLAKRAGVFISVFMVGDGVLCAKKGQKTPDGYYNIDRMVQSLTRRCKLATWGTCCDARELGQEDLVEGVTKGTMDLQGEWTIEADKVLVF